MIKGVVKKDNDGKELIVQYININQTKELKINPRNEKNLKEGLVVDFEEIKINPMGRKVDPMNLAQNQSSCIWVADIKQTYEDKDEYKEIYSEIENLLINWEINQEKTAGFITREIINMFEKYKTKKTMV